MEDQNGKKTESTKPLTHKKSIDWMLGSVVIGSLVFISSILVLNLAVQIRNYSSIIVKLLKDSSLQSHSLILTYSRSLDFAIIKTSALFLGYLLILIGTLYVLRNLKSSYSLSASNRESSTLSFKTTSPGLVIITLGIITVNVTLFTKSYVGIDIVTPYSLEQRKEKPDTIKTKKELKPVFFEPGTYVLSKEQLSIIDENIAILKGLSLDDILIEGFTGEKDGALSEEEKIALSEKRADFLRVYLSSKMKAPHISSISYGKSPPLIDEKKEEDLALL